MPSLAFSIPTPENQYKGQVDPNLSTGRAVPVADHRIRYDLGLFK